MRCACAVVSVLHSTKRVTNFLGRIVAILEGVEIFGQFSITSARSMCHAGAVRRSGGVCVCVSSLSLGPTPPQQLKSLSTIQNRESRSRDRVLQFWRQNCLLGPS